MGRPSNLPVVYLVTQVGNWGTGSDDVGLIRTKAPKMFSRFGSRAPQLILEAFEDERRRCYGINGGGDRSGGGFAHICTRNRNRLSARNISLALFLNKAWGKCREMGLQGAVDEMYDGSDEEEME